MRRQSVPGSDANCVTAVGIGRSTPDGLRSGLNTPEGIAGSALEAGRIPDGRRMRYPPSRRDRPEKTVNQQENSKIPDDRPLAVFCDFD